MGWTVWHHPHQLRCRNEHSLVCCSFRSRESSKPRSRATKRKGSSAAQDSAHSFPSLVFLLLQILIFFELEVYPLNWTFNIANISLIVMGCFVPVIVQSQFLSFPSSPSPLPHFSLNRSLTIQLIHLYSSIILGLGVKYTCWGGTLFLLMATWLRVGATHDVAHGYPILVAGQIFLGFGSCLLGIIGPK